MSRVSPFKPYQRVIHTELPHHRHRKTQNLSLSQKALPLARLAQFRLTLGRATVRRLPESLGPV
jgi:hypothetical protein